MTTPNPQCWRPVPSVCEINPILSRVCKMGTRGCQSTHDKRAYITDPNMDAAQMNRLIFAVERLAYSLAASGGQLVQESGYGESDIARAALDAARGRVGEAKPGDGPPCPNCKTVLVRFGEAFRCLNCGHDVPAPQ